MKKKIEVEEVVVGRMVASRCWTICCIRLASPRGGRRVMCLSVGVAESH
jgi:hypothetical protein